MKENNRLLSIEEINRNAEIETHNDRRNKILSKSKHSGLRELCITKAPDVIRPETIQKHIQAARQESLHNAVNTIVNMIVQSMGHQEDPKNRIITACEIIPKRYINEVWIQSDCDGWCEDVKMLFSYYPDELVFSAIEFIGLTESAAIERFHRKDVAYLRS